MVCKEEIKGQVQMFWSGDAHSSPWESFSYLITQIAPFYLKNTRDKPHRLLATEDAFATLQPYPIHPKVWCVPVSGATWVDCFLHCLINILGGHSGSSLPRIHPSASCLYKCSSIWEGELKPFETSF